MVIAKEITDEVDKMPQFPQNLLTLQQNLNDPNCDYNTISEIPKDLNVQTLEIGGRNTISEIPNRYKGYIKNITQQ